MGLFSIFQRGSNAAPAAAEPGDPVQAARIRARQRLIGAVVLVVVGVIVFPLVFETQPRPIPLDIPIEIPRRDGAPPLALPAPRPAPAAKAASGLVAPSRDEIVTETRADAGKDVPPPAAASAVPAPAGDAARKAAAAPKTASAPVAAPTDAARAKALLEGKETPATVAKAEPPKDPAKDPAKDTIRDPAKEAGRYVVQVGAFADAAAARETRSKVEKLGLKTYTQVVETASGSRTRVRVGPFVSRDEADRALAKAREAGINAVVLTL
jgi:DedD protein